MNEHIEHTKENKEVADQIIESAKHDVWQNYNTNSKDAIIDRLALDIVLLRITLLERDDKIEELMTKWEI